MIGTASGPPLRRFTPGTECLVGNDHPPGADGSVKMKAYAELLAKLDKKCWPVDIQEASLHDAAAHVWSSHSSAINKPPAAVRHYNIIHKGATQGQFCNSCDQHSDCRTITAEGRGDLVAAAQAYLDNAIAARATFLHNNPGSAYLSMPGTSVYNSLSNDIAHAKNQRDRANEGYYPQA